MHEYSFVNDYWDGGHPLVFDAIRGARPGVHPGYGCDEITAEAVRLLRKRMSADSDIHFISGGTQTNLIVISSMLRPHEAIIGAETAHINVHETGAIEATGHKVVTAKPDHGKLTTSAIQNVLDEHTDEHMVKPAAVFISNATEMGTVYTMAELTAISELCRERGLLLFLDGARLGSALCSDDSDVSLEALTKLTDVFYIGGAKNGALFGEAVVINNEGLKKDFRYHLKQRGALLAKGWVLAAQFLGLFRDDLWFVLARRANTTARALAEGLESLRIEFLIRSGTNQIFPIFDNVSVDKLKERFDFYVWQRMSASKSAVRLVTSWATPMDAIDEFIKEVKARCGR